MRNTKFRSRRFNEINLTTIGYDIGVGVDIVDIRHFNNLNLKENKNLLEKIFTQKELDYCFSKKNSAQHLAVRYSGKESVVKALNCLGFKNPPYNHIEITNKENGVPQVNINSDKFQDLNINISLSHCNNKAIAFVVAIKVKLVRGDKI